VYLFSNTKEQMHYGQPEVKAKAGGKAQRGLPVTSSLRISDCDGRLLPRSEGPRTSETGAAAMGGA